MGDQNQTTGTPPGEQEQAKPTGAAQRDAPVGNTGASRPPPRPTESGGTNPGPHQEQGGMRS